MSRTPHLTTTDILYWSFVVTGNQSEEDLSYFLTCDGLNETEVVMTIIAIGDQRFALHSLDPVGKSGIFSARIASLDAQNNIALSDQVVGPIAVSTGSNRLDAEGI